MTEGPFIAYNIVYPQEWTHEYRSSHSKASERRASHSCLFCFAIIASFTFALPVFAQQDATYQVPNLGVPIPGVDLASNPLVYRDGTISVPYLATYIGGAYNYLIGVSIIAAAIMIIWGGFRYLLGSTLGDAQAGKEKIKDAIIGLFLILGSYTLLTTLGGPSLTTFQPLNLDIVSQEQYEAQIDSGGVPIEYQTGQVVSGHPDASIPTPSTAVTATSQIPPSPGGGAAPAFSGKDVSGLGKGCTVDSKYHLPGPGCSGAACQTRFCVNKDYNIPGIPSITNMVGFQGIFPNTFGEQITEKGLTFVVPTNPQCYSKAGCDASKYMDIDILGPRAKATLKWRMDGTMVFQPEARDALIRAGAEAKKEGYFLVIGSGTRSVKQQAEAYCSRIKTKGSALGLALPGYSNHQLGIAVDIGLFKLENGRIHLLTLTGGICGQVSNQKYLGADKLSALEQIMASAGFKHMCQEVWHFDYQGVYAVDCNSCVFPGSMATREAKECK